MKQIFLIALLMLVSTTVGCDKSRKVGEGKKCYYGDQDRLGCIQGLWCEPQLESPGKYKMEKVGLDKHTAVGICRAKSKIGGACTSTDGCAEGSCKFAKSGDKTGVCQK